MGSEPMPQAARGSSGFNEKEDALDITLKH
jgi:hypothetical protein